MKLRPAQILVLGFATVILVGTVLLSLPVASRNGETVGFLNALFTATSAVCVTGLVVVDTYTQYSLFGQIVIMLLIQIGGLGFMTMTTLIFLILGKRITLRERLVMQEALNQLTLAGVVKLTRYIIFTTLIFEAVGALLLSLRFSRIYGVPRGIYYGIFHGVSAFNNAGFDLIGDFKSLTPFVEDPLVNIVIMALIIFGGLGFSVIYDVFTTRNIYKLSLHSKVVLTMTGLLLVVGFLVIYALEHTNPKTLGSLSPAGKILAAAFQSVTPRTAGFNTISLSDMSLAAKYFTIFLMFIGASPGSTGGGVKTSTFALVLMMIYSVITSKENVEIYKRRIPMDNLFKAVVIMLIALLLVLTVSFLLTITERADFMSILFETVSAFGTVGLTLGITPHLSDAGKVLIILTMFSGRVGPLTIALALASKKKTAIMKYPEERILVG
ncbi:TrkH family potassium uptake protein [Thermosediminibacter oceani]|uniref:Potassium uptake protein, TrkH family n=1 Tax=Thermosediminibacter oceani (strain ATCC BAA-1034 / DSM 16646 / JW/IW-1228P) TaxID=555079 RepID=D9RXT2_THEOJ|nr:TrkH family potassium uptake protein [Thermosediminibacter oceani]ADL08156.1 potassium uptake protein, TrkH family [Thermosediminibacter oceani DSM 16646]